MLGQPIAGVEVVDADDIESAPLGQGHEVAVEKHDRDLRPREDVGQAAVESVGLAKELQRLEDDAGDV